MIKLISAAAIAAAGLTLSPSPAKASGLYQQVFRICLHNNHGRMDVCHPFTNCFVDTARKNPWMTAQSLDHVCAQELQFGLNPFR